MEGQLSQRHGRGQGGESPRLYMIFDIPEARLGQSGQTDRANTADLSALRQTFQAVLDGGARMIQLRAKNLGASDLLRVAQEFVPLARRVDAQVFINTHAEIARASGAAGVHRPTYGPLVSDLKSGDALRVGVSTHSHREAVEAQEEGADFVTFSPIFTTASKPGYGPALGLSRLKATCAALTIPVYALAGVTPKNTYDCIAAGAFGVAVMGGILGAKDPQKATGRYLQALSPQR